MWGLREVPSVERVEGQCGPVSLAYVRSVMERTQEVESKDLDLNPDPPWTDCGL